ncbi:pilus assembly protein [Comamonas nitrativorans]|uniref:Pilus assembly protein n=1 Tax=Comamonas nitrativorans TaxID=108437 RepID=A0ABV9GTN6_9BURK
MSKIHKNNIPRHFEKKILGLAAATLFLPHSAQALNLVQEPPIPKASSTYVPPNIIISVDDSGSMNYRLDQENATGATDEKKPVNGVWPSTSRRMNVLKHSLQQVFKDDDLIATGKIRLAWQVMHANGDVTSDEKNVNSATMKINSMRPIDAEITTSSGGRNPTITTTTHRANFLKFVDNLSSNSGTPSHTMFSQADAYMRRDLSPNGPWSTDPGGTGTKSTEYLGCRRNYHIMMTDGRWTGTATGNQQDGKDWEAYGTGERQRKAYSTSSDQTQIYRDDEESTLADWAFKSWMEPLQTSGLQHTDQLKPAQEYQDAPGTETFTQTRVVTPAYETCNSYSQVCVRWRNNGNCREYENQCTGGWTSHPEKSETKTVDLEKYWNPKYNPATWPHMVTYTIGFSDSATTWPGASNIQIPTLAAATSDTDKGGYVGYDKGFIDLVTGWETWPKMNRSNTGNEAAGKEVRSLDLWHAAINGRGRFYPVTKGEDLEKAFRSIIGKINEENAPLPPAVNVGSAASGYSVAENNAGIFVAGYSPEDAWRGWVQSAAAVTPEEVTCGVHEDEFIEREEGQEVAPDEEGTGAAPGTCVRFPSPVDGWEDKTTAERLDALSNDAVKTSAGRLILSWNDENAAGAQFLWDTDNTTYMSAAQKALLGKSSGDTGLTVENRAENILNYIRGDHSLESGTNVSTDKPYRKRISRQGDIVNSEIWYTGGPISNFGLSGYTSFAKANVNRTPMLYVGGNDGMLHGFSALDGTEKIAYVPRGAFANLKHLTHPDFNYDHKYYVDGSPMTGDIKVGSSATDWRTVLVGTMGAGGKGYFVLDVTDPSAAGFNASAASTLVMLDKTRANNETISGDLADLGNITAQPARNPSNLQQTTQIAHLNNGRWAAILGNGYNSENQRPVLLIQYLDGDKSLQRIQATNHTKGTGHAADNGLSAPTLVDLDGNGTPDIVYAGDNLGNIWKFDLLDSDPTKWNVAFGINTPLFTARGPVALNGERNQVQPITAAPIVRANNRNMTVQVDGGGTKTRAIGGLVVAFGTGRNLTANDRATDVQQNVQTLYSIIDTTSYTRENGQLKIHAGTAGCTTTSATACVLPPAAIGTLAEDGAPLAKRKLQYLENDDSHRTLTVVDELNKTTWKNYKGWYVDFPDTGERLLKPMQFYAGTNILAVYSELPDGTRSAENQGVNESCSPATVLAAEGVQMRSFINIMDGTAPAFQIVDYNGDGIFNALDKNVIGKKVPKGSPLLMANLQGGLDKTGGGSEALAPIPEQSMRPNWRQLQ